MADYFQDSPQFINPSYATPEQLATQRAYAEALTKRSGENVNRPAGAFANMISALTAGLERNRANEIQSQAVQGNANSVAALIAQLQSGKGVDPQNLGSAVANPMASPEQRALTNALINPTKVEDVAGRPGYSSPVMGVRGVIPQGPFEPGFRAPETAGSVSTVSPVSAPPFPGSPAARAPVPSTPKVWGDDEAVRQGLYPAPQAANGSGGQAPGPSVLPAAPAPATFGSRFDALAAKDRELTATKTFSQGGAEAQTNLAKGDFDAAAAAPAIQRVAGVMLDDLRASKNMNMGPTAEAKTQFKKILANELPGVLSKEQIEGIASQDSFEKSAAQLTSLITRGSSGTDAQLLNSIKSVPGAHNSKEGAEALLLMTVDVAKQQQALRQATAGAKTAQEYESMRGAFFNNPANRIINPITKNPIEQDIAGQKAAGTSSGYEKTATNPTTGEKLGLRNGKWEPIK